MAEVLKRLKRDGLQSEEKKIADYLDQVENSWQVALVLKDREVQQAKSRADKAEQKLQVREEKLQAEQEKLLKAVNAFLGLGKDIPYIADILNISIEETQALLNKIKAKNM